MQVADEVSSKAAAATPAAQPSLCTMPLGVRSSCTPLGANLASMTKMVDSRAAGRSAKFTKGFAADSYLY